jgi:flavin-dependent dehydrogenase
MHKVDVAIIGAGPAGLTAAHAIAVAAPKLKVNTPMQKPELQAQ